MRTILVPAAVVLAGVFGLAGTAAADGTLTWATANSVATGDQDHSSVASSRTGYTAVVWEDDRDATAPEDPLHSDVFLRVYLNGTSLFEKKVSNGGTGNWSHVQPDVAVRSDGSAVVTWAEDPDGNGVYQIRVKTINAAGTETGSAVANATSAGQQTDPRVAANPDNGSFAVVFTDQQTGAKPTVRLSGYASITSKTYEKQVNATGGTNQSPDVAMGAAGNAIVVWDEDVDDNGYFNIGLASFTPAGAVKLAKRVANSEGGSQQQDATVAANVNGDFVVGWVTDHTGTAQVAVRSFTATGTAANEVYLPGQDPQVGLDDQRYAVAYWANGDDVYVQGLNPDGTSTGRQPQLRANTVTTGRQDEPALAVDPFGQITLSHTDDADGNGFDQVMLGTGLTNSTW